MRYVINDDDLENWFKELKTVLETTTESIELKYVLEEMKAHIDHPLAFDENQKMAQEIVRLKVMLFHFTGEME